jgi:hypothetical protein
MLHALKRKNKTFKNKVKKSFVYVLKVIKSMVLLPNKFYTYIKNLIIKLFKLTKKLVLKTIKTLWTLVTKTVKAIWAVVKDLIAEMWTLLGMFIAWVTLDGSAKTIVGYATLIALIIWVISLPLRMDKEE